MVPANEIVEDDLYMTGDTMTIQGTVRGDVIAAGRVIRVEGIVEGDLVAAAQVVEITGVVEDDVRIAVGENAKRLEALARRACERLDRACHPVVGERDAQGHAAPRASLQILQHVHVASHERAFGDDAHRGRVIDARDEAPTGELVVRLERLVAVRVARERDPLTPPRVARESFAKPLDDVDLHDDLPVEVGARAEPEIRVRRPRVAVRARVKAPPIRIHAPPKPDVGAVVLGERALRLLLAHPQIRRRSLTLPLEVSGFKADGRVAAGTH